MEQNEIIKEYRLLYIEGDDIKDNGTRWGMPEQLKADFPGPQWAIIPADEVPENWPDMSVVNGELVPASAEVQEARWTTRYAAELEAVRAARESRYRAETDELMQDAIEAYAVAHPNDPVFAVWLEAKNRIRRELPKPTLAEQEEGGAE